MITMTTFTNPGLSRTEDRGELLKKPGAGWCQAFLLHNSKKTLLYSLLVYLFYIVTILKLLIVYYEIACCLNTDDEAMGIQD